MITWWGLIVTASRRIASPLRTPKKLQSTALTISISVARRGGGASGSPGESGAGMDRLVDRGIKRGTGSKW